MRYEARLSLSGRCLLAVFGVLLAAGALELARAANGSGDLMGRFSTGWMIALAAYGLVGGAFGLACLSGLILPTARLGALLDAVERAFEPLGATRWALAFLLAAIPSVLLLGPWGEPLVGQVFRAVLVLAAGVAAGTAMPSSSFPRVERWLMGILVAASVFGIAKRLVQVTDYPFKLFWSEGNRLWDYSLYFGRDRYQVAGEFVYPDYLTPGRHGLWGLAFLVPNATIAVVRFWDAILWTLPYALLGLALFSSRRGFGQTWVRLGLVLWVFLFISQGPIYSPLVLGGVLLAAGYDVRKPWRTALVTLLACFYAGISRWTWLVAPALWAGLWALVDSDPARPLSRRLALPASLGTAGLLGGAASYAFMALAFPRPDPVYGTALSQPLLWYRLLPSATNPLGVLPALIMATGPPLALLTWAVIRKALPWDRWVCLGSASVLAAFLGVGLVASVKIGGGSNLHNLDMFLISLVFLVAMALMRLRSKANLRVGGLPEAGQALLILCVAVPAWFTVRQGGPLILPARASVEQALGQARQAIQTATEEGPVLFLDQRQLLTFGQIRDVPLEMDYELKDVVNQAMAANTAFLDGFHDDLAAHRFALIVSPPVEQEYRGRSHPFGEEDDAQVRYLYLPLLEYYEPALVLDEVDVWLLRPRTGEAGQPPAAEPGGGTEGPVD